MCVCVWFHNYVCECVWFHSNVRNVCTWRRPRSEGIVFDVSAVTIHHAVHRCYHKLHPTVIVHVVCQYHGVPAKHA